MNDHFSDSFWSKSPAEATTVVAEPPRPGHPAAPGVYARQEMLEGWDQSLLAAAHIAIAGIGAVGSQTARLLTRAGIGRLTFFDPDQHVEEHNLPRQEYFASQVGMAKARALPANLAPMATARTVFIGYSLTFEEAIERRLNELTACDVVVVTVDSDATRVAASRFCLEAKKPAIVAACSTDARQGYVLTQEIGGPCFLCCFPDAVDGLRYPCSAASIELPAVLSGLILTAIATLVMPDRRRDWCYREVSLAGTADFALPRGHRPRADCPLCHGQGAG